MTQRPRLGHHRYRPESALDIPQGAVEQIHHLHLRNRLQLENLGTRYQRTVQIKKWIMRRRANESHGSALDIRQQHILLSLVKSMDFIHKKNRRPLPQPPLQRRRFSRLPDVRYRRFDAAQIDKS